MSLCSRFYFEKRQSVPVLPLLQDLHRVEAAGLLDGGDAVLLGVVGHHGGGLRRLAGGLGLRRHHRGGGGGDIREGEKIYSLMQRMLQQRLK